MESLTSQVRDFLFNNTDLDIDEVYQVFQGNASHIYAEIRILKDGKSQNAIAHISDYKTKIYIEENSQKSFVDLVKESNF